MPAPSDRAEGRESRRASEVAKRSAVPAAAVARRRGARRRQQRSAAGNGVRRQARQFGQVVLAAEPAGLDAPQNCGHGVARGLAFPTAAVRPVAVAAEHAGKDGHGEHDAFQPQGSVDYE